ncbi:MAG TPA: 2-alkenal reductase [Phycisphaerales bacterium]|nr:2-alkenal reductase [Phycisphaerales bacterium]HCD33795.1 2-alkenal reductase [Phycisphaerales bacterium]|tara:strand:+ start:63855 stop:65309 length:1455 start_codon:yes stop_codon:yes gene_type:complete
MATQTLTIEQRLENAKAALTKADQSQVLKFIDELTDEQKDQLLGQIESVDWVEVTRLVQSHVLNTPEFKKPDSIEPAPYLPRIPTKDLADQYKQAKKHGEKLLRDGKVAAFTVAGGQGTRLGWNGPKGSYPATAIRKIPLFCCFAEFIRKAEQKFNTTIPWYIMTSPINDAATRAFFEEHGNFGLRPDNIMIFPQGMMPAFDAKTGKALLESPDTLAMAPNGHGGSIKALYTSGAVADMKERGIEQLSYVQVDNPLVKVIDPLFIGLHAQANAEMSSKALPKAYAKEKVGVFCKVDGKTTVIEYTNLPDELAEKVDDKGELVYKGGSIAIHVIATDFIERINTQEGGFALPYNRADKKVAVWDEANNVTIKPEVANAVKLETFVFDALPMCSESVILETDRIEEFSPIKNADEEGALDCPATCKQGQTERAARWLQTAGVIIPRKEDGTVDAVIELSHIKAIDPEDLKDLDLPTEIDAGTEVLI